MLLPWQESVLKYSGEKKIFILRTCLSFVETTRFTLQEFTRWDRRKFLKHFLRLWKGFFFFSASTHRWELLLKYVPNVVKRLIDTRWSALYEAVKSLQQCFVDVVGTLNEFCDQNKNIDTRGQARGILDAIQRFSFVSFIQFGWKS